jgi:hypothetical protein
MPIKLYCSATQRLSASSILNAMIEHLKDIGVTLGLCRHVARMAEPPVVLDESRLNEACSDAAIQPRLSAARGDQE